MKIKTGLLLATIITLTAHCAIAQTPVQRIKPVTYFEADVYLDDNTNKPVAERIDDLEQVIPFIQDTNTLAAITSRLAQAEADIANRVEKTGDTMSGDLTMSVDTNSGLSRAVTLGAKSLVYDDLMNRLYFDVTNQPDTNSAHVLKSDVMGAGSGIDAEFLAGQPASAYGMRNELDLIATITFTSNWSAVGQEWAYSEGGINLSTDASISNGLLWINSTNLVLQIDQTAPIGAISIVFDHSVLGNVITLTNDWGGAMETAYAFPPEYTITTTWTNIGGYLSRLRFVDNVAPPLPDMDGSTAISEIRLYAYTTASYVGKTNDTAGVVQFVNDSTQPRGAVNNQKLGAAVNGLEAAIRGITPNIVGITLGGKPVHFSPNFTEQASGETLTLSYAGQPMLSYSGGGTVAPHIVSMQQKGVTTSVRVVSSPAWQPILQESTNLQTWTDTPQTNYYSSYPNPTNSMYLLQWTIPQTPTYFRVLAISTNSLDPLAVVVHAPLDAQYGVTIDGQTATNWADVVAFGSLDLSIVTQAVAQLEQDVSSLTNTAANLEANKLNRSELSDWSAYAATNGVHIPVDSNSVVAGWPQARKSQPIFFNVLDQGGQSKLHYIWFERTGLSDKTGLKQIGYQGATNTYWHSGNMNPSAYLQINSFNNWITNVPKVVRGAPVSNTAAPVNMEEIRFDESNAYFWVRGSNKWMRVAGELEW